MPKVVIDGVEYVPRADVPTEAIGVTKQQLLLCLQSLTEIQYFSDQKHKHRAWAWDALHALSPTLAELSTNDPCAAFDRVRAGSEYARGQLGID